MHKQESKPVHFVEQHDEFGNNNTHSNDDDSGTDTEYVFTASTCSTQSSRFTVYVNNQPITCLADSGATVNLLSQEDYSRLCPKPPLEKSNTTISAYGNQYSFSATEQFQAELRSEYCSCSLTVCVVPGREKKPNSKLDDFTETQAHDASPRCR